MARPKDDGKGRLGGRAKGTPNKITSDLKEWLEDMIQGQRGRILADLECLDPRDRLLILEKFMAYIIPKQQSVKSQIDVNKQTSLDIAERLRVLAALDEQ